MIGRVLASLLLGFVLGTTGLVVAPDLGRIAGPTLCAGELVPERGRGALRFGCVGRDGRITPLAPDEVILHTVAICAAAALVPVSLLLRRREARERHWQGMVRADLAAALPARAQVLRVGAAGSLKRQILMRAAELHLTLWVTPAHGRPYEAAVTWFVEQEAIERLAVGGHLAVRVNPAHPERIYPAEPWAQLLAWRAAGPGLSDEA